VDGTQSAYWEYLQTIILSGIIWLIVNWIARSRGFYTFPSHRQLAKNPLSLKTVIAFFAIYLISTLGIATLIAYVVRAIYSLEQTSPPPMAMGWVQLSILAIIICFFCLYCKTQDLTLIKKIWKDWSIPNPKPIVWDLLIGFFTWFISFPLVVAIGQLADMLLLYLFQFESYEQVAVRYLKTTLTSPGMLAVALFTILIAAPIIEEFLFRGLLQTYFKRHMNVKIAMICSSLCFALFHLAPSQGIGNISLVASLFTFALFLGFIYERQGSLFASIGLHMTFNAMSTIRILWMPE
jgi:membrane protease YdiL (CAAX protease family)